MNYGTREARASADSRARGYLFLSAFMRKESTFRDATTSFPARRGRPKYS